MRLALLSPLPPELSGLADYAGYFRAALNQAGVDVLTPLAGQRPIGSLGAARAWVAERDWRRVDVVHAELGVGRHSEFFTLCALAALPNRPALSITVHDPERLIWRPVNRVWTALDGVSGLPDVVKHTAAILSEPVTLMAERHLARRVDGLVTMTQLGAGKLIKRMKVSVDQVSVIPHGVHNLPYRPLPPLDPLQLLYFGFINKGKGIEDLIDALGRIKSQQPEMASMVRLTVAGGMAPDAELHARRSYLAELKARIEKRGLAGQIQWELDVDERDIPHLFQQHHLVVLPYRETRRWDVIGRVCGATLAMSWAIACGRGVIGSDARALAEEVGQGNGVSFRQGDVAALAGLIEGVLNQPLQLKQWADRANTLAQERAWAMTGQRFVGHFQRAMARAPRARSSASGPASSWSHKESL